MGLIQLKPWRNTCKKFIKIKQDSSTCIFSVRKKEISLKNQFNSTYNLFKRKSQLNNNNYKRLKDFAKINVLLTSWAISSEILKDLEFKVFYILSQD